MMAAEDGHLNTEKKERELHRDIPRTKFKGGLNGIHELLIKLQLQSQSPLL